MSKLGRYSYFPNKEHYFMDIYLDDTGYFIGIGTDNKKMIHRQAYENVLDHVFNLMVRGVQLTMNPKVIVRKRGCMEPFKKYEFNLERVKKELSESLEKYKEENANVVHE